MPSMGAFQANTKRETGKKAQQSNIQAAKAVSDIVRTTLGPRAMLKMLLDANGGIVLTNDGNAILREIDVSHPAAKSMIELSRTQDEEVGDGTTSVIILAGEMLHVAEPFLERNLHPTQIVRGYHRALEDAKKIVDKMAFPVDTTDRAKMLDVISSCIDTKFTHRFGSIMSELALDAVRTVVVEMADGQREIDIKKYAKIEKIPGGDVTECRVLKGVMFQKDVVSPDRMRRRIVNPRILLLDCPLEYKKGENQTNIELAKEEDWQVLMRMEEEWIQRACESIIAHKPNVVVTEKGLSDLAAHYLQKAGISAVRRLRKTDNNRIARATGATIVNRPEEIRASDIGTKAGLFEVKKIGDEFFCFIVDCQDPKACSILLRGASKDMLNEVERNLHDAMGVARNIMQNPKMVPGGGVCEMAISRSLSSMANSVEGVERGPYEAIGKAMEVVPRTLAQNCGANVIRTLTELRARHSSPGCTMGIDGNTGKITDMKELGIWEPQEVKVQSMKTAVEAAILLLRIDDIVSGMKKSGRGPGPSPQGPQRDDPDNVDSEQALPE